MDEMATATAMARALAAVTEDGRRVYARGIGITAESFA
jgi:hypothetical protein